jgi:cytochrome c oxidase assembly protein subunit 11
MSVPVDELRRRNRRLVRRLTLVALGAFGFAFAMVPLYRVACEQWFGIKLAQGGTAPVAQAPAYVPDRSRTVTVTFDANLADGLAWAFEPKQPRIEVHPGEVVDIAYVARNLADVAVVGQAVPSIAPNTASIYFTKTECFCFTRQLLAAHETKELPVRFVIDPALPASIGTLTLSYTFTLDPTATRRLAATGAPTAPPI